MMTIWLLFAIHIDTPNVVEYHGVFDTVEQCVEIGESRPFAHYEPVVCLGIPVVLV